MQYKQHLQKDCQFYRRVYRRNYTRRYFTESYKKITVFCHNYRRVYQRAFHNYRRIYRHVHRRMVPIPNRTPLSSYQRICWWTQQNQCARVLAHNFWQTSKNMEGFLKILVRESINYPKNYYYIFRWQFRRKNCCINPPLRDSFLLRSSFHLLFSSPFVLSFCKSFYCYVGSFQHIKRYVFFFLYLCIFLLFILF